MGQLRRERLRAVPKATRFGIHSPFTLTASPRAVMLRAAWSGPGAGPGQSLGREESVAQGLEARKNVAWQELPVGSGLESDLRIQTCG